MGGHGSIEIDTRVIAATNRNLEVALARGEFREDLYYRLNVVELHIPPLRERRDDIPRLAALFLARFNGEYGRQKQQLSAETLARLNYLASLKGEVPEISDEDKVEWTRRAQVAAEARRDGGGEEDARGSWDYYLSLLDVPGLIQFDDVGFGIGVR